MKEDISLQMLLIIFTINIVYVTFFTVRMIMTLKGYRYIAAAVQYGGSYYLCYRSWSSAG